MSSRLYPVFREPGHGNTSNPYVGRALDGTQELVQGLEELCGPEDTVISTGGALVQPLMYRRALTYGQEHVDTVLGIERRMRIREMLGGIVGYSIERVEVKRQRDNELFTVRALLGNNAVRQQLVHERRFVEQNLPPYANRSNVVTSLVRVAETPSLSFANLVADRLLDTDNIHGELLEPQIHFTPPFRT